MTMKIKDHCYIRDRERPPSSMSTFSTTGGQLSQPSTPAGDQPVTSTPSKRSRSLGRGRGQGGQDQGVMRHSRSVSSDDGSRNGIRHAGQLSHSTPQVYFGFQLEISIESLKCQMTAEGSELHQGYLKEIMHLTLFTF